LIAYGSSLDQAGPMTRSVADAALILQVIAGVDPLDGTSVDQLVPDYLAALKSCQGLRVGIPSEYFGEGLDPEVADCVQRAITLFGNNGHSTTAIQLPHTPYAVPTYYTVACAEASSNLARYDGAQYGYRPLEAEDIVDLYTRSRSEGFGPEVKRRIMLGTYVLSSGFYDAYYLKASRVRTLIARDFQNAFNECDIIAHPVAPTPAFRIGEKTDNPLTMYLGDIYTVTANLAGLPAISIPCGKTASGLPVGIQLVAPALREDLLLAAAGFLEKQLAQAGYWTAAEGCAIS
jgi:aspartyl-tRNA(Asn)/glutamyl-tRNA(Gln) amidotransferase subunit A